MGSIVKIGTGNLTLENANTYTGGTVVNDGILLANGATNSNTGSGPVLVTAGTFGGGGKVTGPVTIGTGSGLGAILAPGTVGVVPGTFSIGKNLQLLADATLKVLIDSASQTMDKVVAKGIRIRRAQIVFSDRNANVLPAGTSFTAIDNTSTKPISGTFLDLPDGGTVTVGDNILPSQLREAATAMISR
jgi:autotransporter-associated beta strand protein